MIRRGSLEKIFEMAAVIYDDQKLEIDMYRLGR